MAKPPTNNLLVAVVLLLGAAGCGSPDVEHCPALIGHYLGPTPDLRRVTSVAFVDLGHPSGLDRVSRQACEAIFVQLQEKRLFHIETISRDDPRCLDLPLDQKQPFELTQLAAMRKALGCEAVLVGEIYYFTPYPRMKTGLYLRLVDLKRGKLLWAIDHTWDTTEKGTEHRIHEYFEDNVRSGFEPANANLVQMSPQMFMRFVAHEACATLPSRYQLDHPQPPPTGKDRAKAACGEMGKEMGREIKKGAESIQEDM